MTTKDDFVVVDDAFLVQARGERLAYVPAEVTRFGEYSIITFKPNEIQVIEGVSLAGLLPLRDNEAKVKAVLMASI